jgi:hypothetical protein
VEKELVDEIMKRKLEIMKEPYTWMKGKNQELKIYVTNTMLLLAVPSE